MTRTDRVCLYELYDKWSSARAAANCLKEDLADALRPLLGAMGIKHVDVDEVRFERGGLIVEYSWNSKGCDQDSSVFIPDGIVNAENYVQAVADMHEAQAARGRKSERDRDLQELTRLQLKLSNQAMEDGE